MCFTAFVLILSHAVLQTGDTPRPPGVVIDHSPASSGLYIGSPSLAELPNGDYVSSHDFFGPKSNEFKSARSVVFRSKDRGKTWSKIAEIQGAFWSSLFVHRGQLYLIGTNRHHGDVVIRRSSDGGETWTEPKDSKSGMLRPEGEYHCAPMPVIEHNGRLWRAFEWRNPPIAWGINYRSGVLSAPVDADLLDAKSWTATNFLPSDRKWNAGDMGAWLEGNVVVAPDGALVNVLRVQTKSPDEKAAIVRISADGMKATFDPANDFVPFPGGAKKFTIRFDPKTKRYWSLATIVHEKHRAPNPGGIRNTLALTSSVDLRSWTVHKILLYHPDVKKHGFQYVDWRFEGDELIAVCRTAFDDGVGGARNNHDANFLTFHRIAGFRKLRKNTVDPPAKLDDDLAPGEPISFATAESDDKSAKEKNTPESIREKLVGVWSGFAVEGKGENPDRGAVKLELTITKDGIKAKQFKGQKELDLGEGTFEVRIDGDKRQLDGDKKLDNPNRKEIWLGIYNLEGDTLKWCVGRRSRPSEFETTKGAFLLVLKRKAK